MPLSVPYEIVWSRGPDSFRSGERSRSRRLAVAQSRKGSRDSVNWVPVADRLVWARVMRPLVPIVYLDLNHFINLSKAQIDPDAALPGYPNLLKAAIAAAREKRAVFPLSAEHLFELSAIKDPRQRKGIADVMEALSLFEYILGRPEIAQLEIEAGIQDLLAEPPELAGVPLIGSSFGWAFGMVGGMRIVDTNGEDASSNARREMGTDGHERFMRFANYTIERAMLDGPTDEEIPALRENGYAPEVVKDSQMSRLAFEQDLSAKLTSAPEWRRGRLRDVVAAREVAHEWLDVINEVNEQRVRAGRASFDATDDDMRRFFAAMPHTQVAISMKTRYHRNPGHRWTTNDIADIDALSVAYAYCDAVFTDKAARSTLAQSAELRVFDTFLPRTVQELTDWLDQLPARAATGILVPHPLK